MVKLKLMLIFHGRDSVSVSGVLLSRTGVVLTISPYRSGSAKINNLKRIDIQIQALRIRKISVILLVWDVECFYRRPSKKETLGQCCYNAGPPSATVAQHCNSIGSVFRVHRHRFPLMSPALCLIFPAHCAVIFWSPRTDPGGIDPSAKEALHKRKTDLETALTAQYLSLDG